MLVGGLFGFVTLIVMIALGGRRKQIGDTNYPRLRAFGIWVLSQVVVLAVYTGVDLVAGATLVSAVGPGGALLILLCITVGVGVATLVVATRLLMPVPAEFQARKRAAEAEAD